MIPSFTAYISVFFWELPRRPQAVSRPAAMGNTKNHARSMLQPVFLKENRDVQTGN